MCIRDSYFSNIRKTPLKHLKAATISALFDDLKKQKNYLQENYEQHQYRDLDEFFFFSDWFRRNYPVDFKTTPINGFAKEEVLSVVGNDEKAAFDLFLKAWESIRAS